MTFKPAPEDFGIRFRRVDLGGKPEIPADVDHVIDVSRGTTIGIGEAKVHTVEHVLAAIAGLQIDNILIDLEESNRRSATEALSRTSIHSSIAGFEAQDAPKDYLVIDRPLTTRTRKGSRSLHFLPTTFVFSAGRLQQSRPRKSAHRFVRPGKGIYTGVLDVPHILFPP